MWLQSIRLLSTQLSVCRPTCPLFSTQKLGPLGEADLAFHSVHRLGVAVFTALSLGFRHHFPWALLFEPSHRVGKVRGTARIPWRLLPGLCPFVPGRESAGGPADGCASSRACWAQKGSVSLSGGAGAGTVPPGCAQLFVLGKVVLQAGQGNAGQCSPQNCGLLALAFALEM